MIDARVVGLEQLGAEMERAAAAAGSALAGAVGAAASAGATQARSDAPVATGALRDSIEGRVTRASATRAEGVVRPRAPHARYVIEGTDPHVIEPRRASALVFEGKDGSTVFARRVNHPGTRANDFLVAARREAEARLRAELDGVLRSAYARLSVRS